MLDGEVPCGLTSTKD
jgi:hypothetical protein